jgi:hypothetical protein
MGLHMRTIWAKRRWKLREVMMATPGQLVKCIAEALSIPEPTVIQYDRLLAENGLRSKGGRGTSAAKVTPVDAANLLIAILGSPIAGASIKPAIEICKTYGRLPLKVGSQSIDTFKKLGFATVAKLPPAHALRDGIAAIIRAASVGESLIIPVPEEAPLTGPANDWHVSITLNGPTPWAEIVADASLGEAMSTEWGRLVYHNLKREPGDYFKRRYEDLHQSRHITFRSIRRIGALLDVRELNRAGA